MIIREVVNFIKILVRPAFYLFAPKLTDFNCLYNVLYNLSCQLFILYQKYIQIKRLELL